MPDPIQTAISALADRIRDQVLDLDGRCTKGWPDPREAFVLPCASITHADGEREGREEREISQTAVPGDSVRVDVAYEVANWTVPIQLDVWGRSRTERGEITVAIRSLFTDPDVGDDMRLVLTDYHDRLATFQIDRDRDTDNADSAEHGEWRKTIELTLEVPEVVVKRQALLKTITTPVEVYNPDETMS